MQTPETDLARHLVRSLKARWKRYARALKRCRRRFSEDSVHDTRIEARRLLSVLELLAVFLPDRHLKSARRLLKRHLDLFSELRDTQLQLLHTEKLLPRFPDLRAFDQALRKRERRCIRQARAKIKRLKPAKLQRQLKVLRAELKAQHSRDLRRLSLRAVDRAFAEVSGRRRRVTSEDTATIHRTRVAFKHFRYMLEGLQGAWPGLTDKRLRAMQGYQALMGEIQDNEVLLASVRQFTRAKHTEPGVARLWTVELQRQRRLLVARYLKRADQLNEFWPLTGAGFRTSRQTPGTQP
jgi:CHAD domain-containing protein